MYDINFTSLAVIYRRDFCSRSARFNCPYYGVNCNLQGERFCRTKITCRVGGMSKPLTHCIWNRKGECWLRHCLGSYFLLFNFFLTLEIVFLVCKNFGWYINFLLLKSSISMSYIFTWMSYIFTSMPHINVLHFHINVLHQCLRSSHQCLTSPHQWLTSSHQCLTSTSYTLLRYHQPQSSSNPTLPCEESLPSPPSNQCLDVGLKRNISQGGISLARWEKKSRRCLLEAAAFAERRFGGYGFLRSHPAE